MKLSISSTILRDAVSCLQGLTTSKSLPVLGGIRLEAWLTGFILEVTNLDIWHRMEVPLSCEQGGEVVVPCAKLHQWLQTLGEGSVSIQHKNGDPQAILSHGSAVLKLPVITDAFPAVPGAQWSKPVGGFPDALAKALPFASREAHRPNICGVHVGDGYVEAADGHSIIQVQTGVRAEALIPTALARMASQMADHTFRFSENLVQFQNEEETIIGTQLAFTYPVTEQFFKYQPKAILRTSKHDLLDAANRAAIGATHIKLNCSTTKAEISNYRTEDTDSLDSIGIEMSEPMEFGIELKLLQRALRACEQDEIELRFTDSSNFHIEQTNSHIVIYLCRIQ